MTIYIKAYKQLIYIIVSAIAFSSPAAVMAQALEEIVVTAQRREQSLQEVPISIEAFSGAEIQSQGFRDMVELSSFSPAVQIEQGQSRTNITIRGVGTAGNNQALEQSAPTFVDGVHFGRTSQIMGAFLDVDRVEVLRGPQPVYFGQNASAGAFSITTRKPGPEWSANIRAEVGNNNTQTLEFGAGGPINDTWGIRVAGKYDRSEGYLRDLLTSDKFPAYDVFMGRTILQWTPTDNFQATAKFQFAKKHTGGNGVVVRRGKNANNPPTGDRYGEYSLITGVPNANFQPVPADFSEGWGVVPGNTFLNPGVAGVAATASRAEIDLSGFLPEYLKTSPYGPSGPDTAAAQDDQAPWDAYLDLTYTLDNGIELSSLSGYSYYKRHYQRDNSGTYFLSNFTFRSEHLDQWTQEFRITSPTGGMFEWMAGVYYHNNDLDLKTVGLRANTRRPARNPTGSEDAEWKSAFAAVTFNFFDDMLSLDLGGRYTDVDKQGVQTQFIQEWIFSDGAGGQIIVPNETRHNAFVANYPQLVGATPIGITPEVRGEADGVEKNDATFKTEQFDPQIVLRYRPSDDVSVYAKYAEAFKSGGFEVELKSSPPADEFVFGNETAKSYEAGIKSTLLDGRARFNATIFRSNYYDLQIATELPIAFVQATGINSQTVNASQQRVQGIEWDTSMAVSDRWTLGFAGGLFDGEMVSFDNAGCTDAEVATNQCDDPAEGTTDRSGDDAPRTPSWVFTLNSNYEMPFMDQYLLGFNARFKYSDGYLTDIESFDQIVKYDTHADLNLSVSLGDMNDVWAVSLYGRNLTEPQVQYFPEFDVDPDQPGVISTTMGPSAYRSYGVQFRYNYN